MSPAATAEDREHLLAALALGRRGRGRVHPNPAVGCVIVRDGTVVGAGWHEEFGAPHAEAHAVEAAGADARGATAYVGLEPCRHEGKTPACVPVLVRAGLARVVYGAADPTSDAGGGAAALREAGVDVTGPLMSVAEARRENPAFFHRVVSDLPWLALKLAVSLDGRIAARAGERTSLSGPEARAAVHRLRARVDAVMVGARTARVDDPLLTVREGVGFRKAPARIVLDTSARLDPGAALFRDGSGAPVVVFVAEDASEHAMERLEAAGATVHPVPRAATGNGLDLEAVLEVCRDTGLHAILCEGGGRLAASLLEADRVERLHLLVAPRLLGERGVAAFPGEAPAVADAWDPAAEPERHGPDVELIYDRPRPWSHGDDPLWPTPAGEG